MYTNTKQKQKQIYVYIYIYICIYPPTPKASACETIPILPNKNLLIQPTFQYKQASKKQQSKKTKRPNTFNKPGRLIRS